jgi:hypothetical protein
MRSDTGIFRALGPAQTLTTTSAAAVRSTAVGAMTQHVRITATAAPVWVAFGGSTVDAAANTGVVLLAGQTDVFRIAGGQFISVIRIGATDATVYVSELCY